MYRHHQSESQYHYDPVLLTIDWIILSNNTTIRHQVCLFCVHPPIGGDLLYTIFTDWIVIPWSLCKCDQITRLTLACHFPPHDQHHKTPPNWMVMVRNRVIYMTGGLNTGLTDWLFPENWILIKTADLTAIFSFISGLFGFTWYFPRKDHLNKILLHCHW